MAREDYYSILGIDKQAPEREIKRAYYELARDLHPDRAKTPEDSKVNAERLAVISKAYNALKDPTRKAEYDAANKGGGGGGSPPAAPQSISQMSTGGQRPARFLGGFQCRTHRDGSKIFREGHGILEGFGS